MEANKIKLEKYTAWRYENIEVRNYGSSGYNVYYDGTEIDYFTISMFSDCNIEEIISEHINEILFNNLF